MGGSDHRSSGGVTLYYLATPVFMAADYLWGLSVRAAAFDAQPRLKLAYYLICCGCAGVAFWKPVASAWVGLLESTANIIVLILGILLPIFRLPDLLMSGATPANPITLHKVANFILASGVWTFLFYRNLRLGERGGA